jgi:HlyD family secretion protein
MPLRRALVLVAVLAVGLLAVLWLRRPSGPPPFAGYVEAEYVKVAPVQSGLLTELSVSRGQTVQAGTPLFAQDDSGDRAARDEAAARLRQAEAQLANLQGKGRVADVDAAQATVAEARAGAVLARDELQRGESLIAQGAIPPQRIDELRSGDQQAKARVATAEARLAALRTALGRADEIQAQRDAVDAARAAVAQATWRLGQRRVNAPVAALVADTLFRPGEQVNAGLPVVSLLSPQNVLVRFFVPEPALPSIQVSARVDVTCDQCPAGLSATVSFIAPQPEYTPPVIYSEQVRGKLVFLVEAHPPPDSALSVLKPGQPVDIRVHR